MKARRLVSRFAWAPLANELTIYVDANWAACKRTRLSIVGGVALWGKANLKTWSKTAKVVCMSSAESELAAVTRGGAEGLGLQSLLRDFGREVRIRMCSDATAAIGMVKRQGLGAVRHLATADLWMQAKVKEKRIQIEKVPGKHNPADLLTKVLAEE